MEKTRLASQPCKWIGEMDTGDILLSDIMDIGPDMTVGELHDRLGEIGG